MSFGDDIFGICTPWIVLLLSMIWVSLGLWAILLFLKIYHLSAASPAQVIFITNECLVLVFFLPVSALSCLRKCHQRVSVPSFNA